jgi:hypothetical protein
MLRSLPRRTLSEAGLNDLQSLPGPHPAVVRSSAWPTDASPNVSPVFAFSWGPRVFPLSLYDCRTIPTFCARMLQTAWVVGVTFLGNEVLLTHFFERRET